MAAGISNRFGDTVGRIGPAFVFQDAASIDQVSLHELRKPVQAMDLNGGQVFISNRAFMAADYLIMVLCDKAVADGPLMEFSADKRRCDGELRPAGADINSEPK